MTENWRLEIGDWRLSKNKPLFLNMGKSTISPPKPLSFKQGSIYNLPSAICNSLTEIIFLVEPDDDGGYVAQALGESIITQADDLEALKKEVKDSVYCHFTEETLCSKIIHLHHV